MKLWPAIIIPILIGLALATSGCADSKVTKDVGVSSLIYPLNITEQLKRSEAEVLGYFQERRKEFESLGDYMLGNESLFQMRPVILHQGYAIDKIQDTAIQQFAQRMFQEGVVKMISSLNDNPRKQVDIWVDDEHGLYRQGITYVSLPEMAKGDPSKFSYVKEYKDLGSGWYYYVFHYDKLHEEDLYRELAWSQISDEVRSTLITPKEKAIVILEAGENVGKWLDDRKLDVVVSIEFKTESDGLLGPITMFFDPVTKDLVGSNLRY